MRVFLDFEASSLGDDSYPIEVGWVFEDGAEETHLIAPAAAWTDWSAGAEAVHHLTRERLLAEGEDHAAVARRALAVLEGHEVYVTAPSWDGKWMSVLLRGAGLPRHALRLKEADEAHLGSARNILAPVMDEAAAAEAAAAILAQARTAVGADPVRHRALDDARQELRLWREVRRRACETAGAVAESRAV